MNKILFELGIILLLLAINGVFAMTEIAVVSARKGRLKRLADDGDSRAQVALDLAESPNRFLATVQIGITLVGILAGAFGGATIAEELAGIFQSIPFLAPYGEGLGLAIVVVVITFLSLILGELLPKRIGLANPEGVALFMAGFMNRLSIVAGPFVRLLGNSTEALLRLLGIQSNKESAVTEDEIKLMVQEGLRGGAFRRVESEMVESVLQLDTLSIREIMTPRPKIIWLSEEDRHETVWQKVVGSRFSHFPVYRGQRDEVIGIVSLKAIYANVAVGAPARIADLLTPPLVIPTTQTAIELLDTFKIKGQHIAMVADEFGGIVGLVTLHDVMKAILGDFSKIEERARPTAKKRSDDTWLIDGMISIDQLEEVLPGFDSGEDEGRDYQTLAGFVVKHLGHLPQEGETLHVQEYVFEILDMDRHRVDKVMAKRDIVQETL